MWKHVAPFVLLAACGSTDNTPVPDGSADAPGDVTTSDTPVVDTPSPDDVTTPDATTPDATITDVTAPDATVTDIPVPDAPPPVDVVTPVDTSPIALCSRPLLPLSTSRVTSQRPTLQFARAPGLRNTLVEVCRERDCRAPVLSVDSPDDYLAVPSNLAAGVYFWRIVPRNAAGDTCASATWQFTVPARSLTPPRSWGAALDVNGDGYGDLAVASVDAAGATGSVRVYHGSATGLGDTPAAVYTGLTTRAGGPKHPP